MDASTATKQTIGFAAAFFETIDEAVVAAEKHFETHKKLDCSIYWPNGKFSQPGTVFGTAKLREYVERHEMRPVNRGKHIGLWLEYDAKAA